MVIDLHRTNLVTLIVPLLTLLCFGTALKSHAQELGESEFQTICIACHTIGEGRRIGPDLAGVTDKRSQEWLFSFIKSSQTMIQSGDPDALAISQEYQGLVMPDAFMSDTQITNVIHYLAMKSAAASPDSENVPQSTQSASAETAPDPEPFSQEQILAGQRLFQGEQRLENGGAACNACHDVRNDAVIGGGILAAELTTVFSRMGKEGVIAILRHSPFPVMQAAYKDKGLTKEEVQALVTFLEYADSEEYNQLPRGYGVGLFLSGTIGAGIMFLLFGVIWRGRKIGSVNQKIYDRQVKSQTDGDR